MANGGIRIGEILVSQGVLTVEQVELILDEQRNCSRPFGDLAERMFGVEPKAVEDAWVDQYLAVVGVTDLEEVSVDVRCLRVINRRQAWQFRVLPLNRHDGILAVATDDSNVARALNFATRTINEDVQLVVATRQQLRAFLMEHYPVPREIVDYSERLSA